MMLLLSKALSQLLLPPGGLMVMAGIGLVFWRRWWARGLIALALLLFWMLSIEPVRDLLSASLENQYSPVNMEVLTTQYTRETAVIVVLGSGVRANTPEYQGRDELTRFGMMRATYGANLAKHTDLDIYATGGTPLRENAESEASIMRRWLIWFGVDEQHIYIEDQANTTWENAVLTQNLLVEKGGDTVILVTSAWHMPRAVWCFEAQGLRVIAAPTDYLTQQGDYDLRSFLPHFDVFADSGHILSEYMGMMWYTLKFSDRK